MTHRGARLALPCSAPRDTTDETRETMSDEKRYAPGTKLEITHKGPSVHGGAVIRLVEVVKCDRTHLHAILDNGDEISYRWNELTRVEEAVGDEKRETRDLMLEAYSEGRSARRRGAGPHENQHPKAYRGHYEWDRGWHDERHNATDAPAPREASGVRQVFDDVLRRLNDIEYDPEEILTGDMDRYAAASHVASIAIELVHEVTDAVEQSQEAAISEATGEEDEYVEKYIRSLEWSDDSTDHERTLVTGNLRTFWGRVQELFDFEERLMKRDWKRDVQALEARIKQLEQERDQLYEAVKRALQQHDAEREQHAAAIREARAEALRDLLNRVGEWLDEAAADSADPEFYALNDVYEEIEARIADAEARSAEGEA